MTQSNGTCEGGVALLTGAGSGIGRAAALIFAREGARVVVTDQNEDNAHETLGQVTAGGGEGLALQVNVTDDVQIAAMVGSAVEAYGRIDHAVNCAGISDTVEPFHERERSSWDRMIAINLTGVFVCMQAEITQMLSQEPRDGRRGTIVNVSSGAGRVPAPGRPHYTAAKHGVLGLTRCAAQDYLRSGIRTNAILPGLTETGMTEYLKTDPSGEAIIKMMPGGRMADPSEMGEGIVWLSSERASWVNGQGISIDGGAVMH
jgi:NAD(P)-dependent dehydrogenase (short-subunit alcohol dehydrogenase family)